MSEYWSICVEEALSDSGIVVTPEQLAQFAGLIQGAAEMELEASGSHEIHRASNAPKPPRGLRKPYERGGSYYMDGSTPDVPYYVEDQDSGKTYWFRDKQEADRFYDHNR